MLWSRRPSTTSPPSEIVLLLCLMLLLLPLPKAEYGSAPASGLRTCKVRDRTRGVVRRDMAVIPSRSIARRLLIRPSWLARLNRTNANSPTCTDHTLFPSMFTQADKASCPAHYVHYVFYSRKP